MNEEPPRFLLNITTMPKAGYSRKLTPDQNEMAAIASSCGLVAINAFEAQVDCRPWHRDGITVSGRISVSMEQACVVSLEPVFDEITTEFSARFVPEGSKFARPIKQAVAGQGDREIVFDFEGDDAPELVEGEEVDLWEVVLEHFNLAIDPFPRAQGQELPANVQEVLPPDAADEEKISPFAALAALKQNET